MWLHFLRGCVSLKKDYKDFDEGGGGFIVGMLLLNSDESELFGHKGVGSMNFFFCLSSDQSVVEGIVMSFF